MQFHCVKKNKIKNMGLDHTLHNMVYPSGLLFEHNNYKRNMETYCVSCRKSTDNVNSKMVKTKNGRLQLKCQCSICGNKESRFVKQQEAKTNLSSLGIRSPLSKIPGLNILF